MNGLLLSLCIIWGFNFVVMKLGNGAFPPVYFAAMRFLVGAIVLFGVAYFKKVVKPKKRDIKWFIVCGILQTTYFNIAIQVSLNYISAGLTSVLTYSMPLFLSVMAHFFIPGDRLNTRKMIGIVTGTLGLFLAMNIHFGGGVWPTILALTSGLSWAVSNVIIKRKLQHCDSIQFTTWQMAIGTVGLFFYSFCFEHGDAHWGFMPIVYILFAGIFPSALAFLLWSYILSKAEASKASMSLLLVPVVGAISGYLFLGEVLSPVTIIGILFVLAGIWFVNNSGSSKEVRTRVIGSVKDL
jgi:drug/metabolite transporter (DMT)-like permease